ncbi:hypothetical protein LINPERPRIM_LOCUS25772 [Linum perenne]
MRKRMERLRLEREKTEKMLKEREMLLDLRMKELQLRGEAQMMLELEVDRLYRLKELHSYSMVKQKKPHNYLTLSFNCVTESNSSGT